MAKSITLHTPARDRHGHFRDAGETLTVGVEGDITADAAAAIIARGGGVEAPDPLDHDADGKRGGSLPRT